MIAAILIVSALFVVGVVYAAGFKKVIVHDGGVGLLFRNGRFIKRLAPGAHRIFRLFTEVSVKLYDMRIRILSVPGQELLTRDNVGVKASVSVAYRIADPQLLNNSVARHEEMLHACIQLALRAAVGGQTVEELLEKRADIGKSIHERAAVELHAVGIHIESADVKDVMFPGELKKIFNEVIRAQKEAQAALEKARGESAAMRSLANAANMMKNNPDLLNLRVLQTLSNITGVSGNTYVLGLSQGIIPMSTGTASNSGNNRSVNDSQ